MEGAAQSPISWFDRNEEIIMDGIASFFGRNGFLPHGYCFTWSPGLLWTMVLSDLLIAAAYLSIPVAIVSFVRQRGDARINRVAGLFGAFILACGTTHMMDVWTIWQPDYGLQALSKAVTAAVSMFTAIAIWPMIPKALSVPSADRLKSVVSTLEAEVSRRRSTEDRLREIESSLSATLASIDAGFISTDATGRVTRMNTVAERVTGWSQSEAQGRCVWTVLQREGQPPEDEQRNPIDVMTEQGATINDVHRFVAVGRDGHRTALASQASVTRDDDGSARGMAIVMRDMTESIRAETESATLVAIVESSGDAIIGKTLDGLITTWNQGAQSMFGYAAEQAIGQPGQMLIPLERQDEEMRMLASVADGEPVAAFDTVRRTRDGRLIDVSLTISPIRDSRGCVIGASKIARDISRQRRDEAALRASEERLRFTLEAAHIGDWSLDLGTGDMQHSLRHDRCFGFDTRQADWSFDRFIALVHPDDRAEVQQSLHVALTERRDWRVQCRVIWPDGSVHWISKHGSAQPTGEKASRMLGIVSEITEQRQAEDARLKVQRLEIENRQIQAANRLKSEFLANMSHELRTPLNAVIGFADLLHSGFIKPDSPKHREFLGHIGTSGRHLLQLINDVLDLSKVESGKFDFFPEPVDLALLLNEVTGILHTAIERRQITLEIAVDPSLTDLRLDPARLKQVLYNYLSNAIKFSNDGGRVTVRAVAEGAEHVRIEVEDTGIGIAPADLPRLFVDFQQLESSYSKQHQGTGLGLALTRRLVQAQGGSVGVRSTLGVSSVFHVVLNRVHGTDAARALPAGHDGAAVMKRVLVIEGNDVEQSRLLTALGDAGFLAETATDSENALYRARQTAFAALTLELQLPDRQGLALLADIRSHGASHASPVIAVSMLTDDASARFAISNLLSKPIRSDEILAVMTQLKRRQSGPPTVLVIDDEAAALELMRATLHSIGIDAVCLDDGREALRTLNQIRPDAIILDLMMPGFDGFQVLDALQQMPTWRHVPVFIWTSLLLTDAEYATLARSARAIVMKGGGALDDVLEMMRRAHPHIVPGGQGEAR